MSRPAEPPRFSPFADDAAARTIGGLTIENGTEGIAIHGSLDIPRDKTGLERARGLKAALDAIVEALEGAALPAETAQADEPPVRVKNPFA